MTVNCVKVLFDKFQDQGISLGLIKEFGGKREGVNQSIPKQTQFWEQDRHLTFPSDRRLSVFTNCHKSWKDGGRQAQLNSLPAI